MKPNPMMKNMKPSNPIQSNPMTTTMPTGAFVLKMKTTRWRLCVVKQEPDVSASSWMLFGQNKSRSKSNATFQMEFKPHQETTMILVNMASNDDDDDACAKLRLVLVAESPAISCIESLWSLKGVEMYRTKPSSLCTALHQYVHMLSMSPQLQPQQQSQPQQSQPQQSQPQQSNHPMQTRSRKH
jgi:hypothetical protein